MRRPSTIRASRALAAALSIAMLWPGAISTKAASTRPLALKRVSFDLPGAPAAIVPADVDGDGIEDLLVVVAYTEWGSISEDRIENMVQLIEVVPAIFDRREARLWLGAVGGGYSATPIVMPLPASVLSVEAGPKEAPVLALTDEGVSGFRVANEAGQRALTLDPLVAEKPLLAGTGTFLAELGFARDVDGDGDVDLLIPADDGTAVHLWSDGKYGKAAVQRIALPGSKRVAGRRPRRVVPLVEVRDLDGDKKPDLVLGDAELGENRFVYLRGEGDGRFAEPRRVSTECIFPDAPAPPKTVTIDTSKKKEKKKKGKEVAPAGPQPLGDLAYVGDLNGDGTIEAVLETSAGEGDDLDDAREPHSSLTFHHATSSLSFGNASYTALDIVGYAFGGNWPNISDEGFIDLDGDGRLDLVTVTLDFSVFQVLKVLATKKISIGVDFHVWWQAPDGSFQEVKGLDLSETIRLDLNDIKLSRFAEFGGDFDGDGKIDFLHIGRGTTVTIHRGSPGCKYASKADYEVELAEEPKDLALVRVADFDADGRADLSVVRPMSPEDEGVTAPVRLDLYLSGAAK